MPASPFGGPLCIAKIKILMVSAALILWLFSIGQWPLYFLTPKTHFLIGWKEMVREMVIYKKCIVHTNSCFIHFCCRHVCFILPLESPFWYLKHSILSEVVQFWNWSFGSLFACLTICLTISGESMLTHFLLLAVTLQMLLLDCFVSNVTIFK